jgi:outer membrane protein assembly factor BamB
VHLLDPADGSIKKSWELCKGGDDFREGFVSSPALVGGRLYLGGLDGRVWCLGMP